MRNTYRAVAVPMAPYGEKFLGAVEAVSPSGVVIGSTYYANAAGQIMAWDSREGAVKAALCILPEIPAKYGDE